MTNYVTPQTWEECARHVEAGGVVEIEDAPGVWINDRAAATTYRGRCGTPDDGWAPRRLVPIETEATGAERYLAGRLDDPEYAEAYRKERGAIDVPDGYEVVVLPVDVVDRCADSWAVGSAGMNTVGDACRDAVARRPRPATERVPWWEAVEDDSDVTTTVTPGGGPTFSAWLRLRDPEGDWWLVVNGCTDLATAYKQKIAPDGTVEVLKDGER